MYSCQGKSPHDAHASEHAGVQPFRFYSSLRLPFYMEMRLVLILWLALPQFKVCQPKVLSNSRAGSQMD
jgi:hypothetical protein